MKRNVENYGDYIYLGAVHGVVAWTAYAVIECLFYSILPWVIKPSYDYIPLHWGFTALLFVLYPAIGLILGGSSGVVLRLATERLAFLQKVQPTIFFPAFATLTVVLGYIINLIINYSKSLGLSELPPLFIAFLLIFGLILSTKSSTWYRRLHFITNPWPLSIVLLGLPWINLQLFHNSSLKLKAMAALSYPVMIYIISFMVQMIADKRQDSNFTDGTIRLSSSKSPHLWVSALLFLLITGFFMKQEPLVSTQKLKSTSMANGRPNVILVTIDTVRADHLSLYGYERDTSTNLKKLAEKASLYTRAIAPSNQTLSTHASIFTGIYARKHLAYFDPPKYHWGRPLAGKFHTLAEILLDRGYLTVGVVANHAYLHSDMGMSQGFQYYSQLSPVPFLGNVDPYFIRQSIRNTLTYFASPSDFDQLYRRATDINKEVIYLLGKLKQEGSIPFFMFINYMDAHDPYIPPPPFDTYYPGKKGGFTLTHYLQMQEEVMTLKRSVTEREYIHFLSQYDGAIAYIDYHLGKLIEKLEEIGLYQNTLIIITSDHGEVFGERNIVGHASSVYQDQVYVPLIVKYPNINERRVFDEVVSLVDLMPSVLDVLGYKLPSDSDGKSLLELDAGKPRLVFSEGFPYPHFSWYPRFRRFEHAIFSKSFKFITSTEGRRELYDLSTDPNEKNDIFEIENDESKKLEKRLAQWLEQAGGTKSNWAGELDQATLDRLKSLGYVK